MAQGKGHLGEYNQYNYLFRKERKLGYWVLSIQVPVGRAENDFVALMAPQAASWPLGRPQVVVMTLQGFMERNWQAGPCLRSASLV
jgi:hypothetical protein